MNDVYSQHFQQIFVDYVLCARYALWANYAMVNKRVM